MEAEEENRKKHPRKNPSPRKRPSETIVDFSNVVVKQEPLDKDGEVSSAQDAVSIAQVLKEPRPSSLQCKKSKTKHKKSGHDKSKGSKDTSKSKKTSKKSEDSKDKDKKKSKSSCSKHKAKKMKLCVVDEKTENNEVPGILGMNVDLVQGDSNCKTEQTVLKSSSKKEKKKSKSERSKMEKKDKVKSDKKKAKKDNSKKDSSKHDKKTGSSKKKRKGKKSDRSKSDNGISGGGLEKKRKQSETIVQTPCKKVKLEVDDDGYVMSSENIGKTDSSKSCVDQEQCFNNDMNTFGAINVDVFKKGSNSGNIQSVGVVEAVIERKSHFCVEKASMMTQQDPSNTQGKESTAIGVESSNIEALDSIGEVSAIAQKSSGDKDSVAKSTPEKSLSNVDSCARSTPEKSSSDEDSGTKSMPEKSSGDKDSGSDTDLLSPLPVLTEVAMSSDMNTSELDTLTGALLDLNRDSAHLTTNIFNRTPRKRKRLTPDGKTPGKSSLKKQKTPQRSWKSYTLRFTPHRKSTPRRTPSKSPGSTPGSTSTPGSIANLNTPTPKSGRPDNKAMMKMTPSKDSIKRRLSYPTLQTPKKIIDENEDVSNLSFPDLTSTSPDLDEEYNRSTLNESPDTLTTPVKAVFEKSSKPLMTPIAELDTTLIQSPNNTLTPERVSESEAFRTPSKTSTEHAKDSKSLNTDTDTYSDRDCTLTPGLTIVELDEDGMSSVSTDHLDINSEAEEDRIDSGLEDKANSVQHLQLTAKNVRSIIHQVITNEQVLDMVRNTLQKDGLENQLKEAIFEPRMTRSRVKEAMQKGDVPLPWTLSPIKSMKQDKFKSARQFLEMSFSDTEENDDAEYRPTAEELEHATDDEESVCSQASDYGSPLSTSSKMLTSPPPSVTSEMTENSQCSVASSMAPPTSTDLPSMKYKRNLSEALHNVGLETSMMTEDEIVIAKRTRSKLPLNNTLIEEIESEFVAPDITADMYDTYCDDTEWKEFLTSLTKTTDLNETNETNDENEDPEYNFLADNEKDEDDEDFRSDKAVNIPKKEVNELMNELFGAYGGAEVLDEESQPPTPIETVPSHLVPSTSVLPPKQPKNKMAASVNDEGEDTSDGVDDQTNSFYPLSPLNLDPQLASIVASDIMRIKHKKLDKTSPEKKSSTLGDETLPTIDSGSLTGNTPKLSQLELIQLQDQMRKHVQLLAQTFIQTGACPTQSGSKNCNSEDKNALHIESKKLLLELDMLGSKHDAIYGHSYFKTPNLDEAIELTEVDLTMVDPEVEEILEKNMRSKVMTKKAFSLCGLNFRQMDVFASSPVFLFPQMLPDYMLLGVMKSEQKRLMFTHAEDNLLAMGMDQFYQLPHKYMLIKKYLLGNKTRDQLRFRHKNLRARQGEAKSALMYWYDNNNQLPEFMRYLELEDISEIKAPKFRDPELLPMWYQAYVCTKNEMNKSNSSPADLDDELALTPTSSVSSPASIEDFKKENQKNLYTRRKAKLAKSKEPELPEIAPKPYVESTVPEIDMSVDQQVMDSLMSAITSDTPTETTNTAPAISDMPLVPSITNTDQDEEPVVMLTASQLQQLGINVNVVRSPSGENVLSAVQESITDPPLTPVRPDNVMFSSTPARVVPRESFSSPSVTGITSEMGMTPSASSKSLIGHAFAEATGISLDELDSLNQEAEIVMSESEGLKMENKKDQELVDSQFENVASPKPSMPTLESLVDGIDEANNDPEKAGESPIVTQDPVKNMEVGEDPAELVQSSDIPTLDQLVDNMEQHSEAADLKSKCEKLPDNVDVNSNDEKHRDDSEPVIIPEESKSNEFVCTPEKASSPIESSSSQDIAQPNSNLAAPQIYASHPQQMPIVTENLVEESPTKSAMRMMAELAQLISPKAKSSAINWPHQHRASYKYCSPKKSPRKPSPLKTLLPRGPIPCSPVKTDLPKRQSLRRLRQSPLKKELNQQARTIAPKGFIMRNYASPTKAVAANICAKARRNSQNKPAAVRTLRELMPKPVDEDEQSMEYDFRYIDDDDGEYDGFTDRLRKESKSEGDLDYLSETETGNDSQPEEDMDEGGDEDEDKLAELMAASTTVRSAPKKAGVGDTKRSKAQKRENLLQLLEVDITGNDPMRDERDTAFAQSYLLKVQHALQDQSEKYESFLQLLYEFGCSDSTPVELYSSMKEVLSDQPALLADFAGFLLPDQAKICGCLMQNISFKKCREFLRKLEIHFFKQPHALQRVVKAFALWQSSSHPDPDDLMSTVKPLLKGQHHLLEEFSKFFDNERPPESCRTVFEEVTLRDSDEEQPEFDGFEEVEFPDGYDEDDLYGSKLCRCTCHNSRDMPKYVKRTLHCKACSVRVVRGRVYVQTDNEVYRLEPSVPPQSPGGRLDGNVSPHDRNQSGDDEPVENIPPSVPKNRKHKQLKLKLLQKSVHTATLSSPPDKQSNVDSLDSFPDHATDDTASGGTERLAQLMSDQSRSASPHVLSCGEDALLSPETLDGAVSQLNGSTRITGPTDFSHMRSEFKKGSNENLENLNADEEEFSDVDDKSDDDCATGTDNDDKGQNSDLAEQLDNDSDFDEGEPSGCDMDSDDSDGAETVGHADNENMSDVPDNDLDDDDDSQDGDMESSDDEGPPEWSREDDRLILETCKREGTGTATFESIASTLHRTAGQVTQRFVEMIQMLNEDEDGTEPSDGEGEE